MTKDEVYASQAEYGGLQCVKAGDCGTHHDGTGVKINCLPDVKITAKSVQAGKWCDDRKIL